MGWTTHIRHRAIPGGAGPNGPCSEASERLAGVRLRAYEPRRSARLPGGSWIRGSVTGWHSMGGFESRRPRRWGHVGCVRCALVQIQHAPSNPRAGSSHRTAIGEAAGTDPDPRNFAIVSQLLGRSSRKLVRENRRAFELDSRQDECAHRWCHPVVKVGGVGRSCARRRTDLELAIAKIRGT